MQSVDWLSQALLSLRIERMTKEGKRKLRKIMQVIRAIESKIFPPSIKDNLVLQGISLLPSLLNI